MPPELTPLYKTLNLVALNSIQHHLGHPNLNRPPCGIELLFVLSHLVPHCPLLCTGATSTFLPLPPTPPSYYTHPLNPLPLLIHALTLLLLPSLLASAPCGCQPFQLCCSGWTASPTLPYHWPQCFPPHCPYHPSLVLLLHHKSELTYIQPCAMKAPSLVLVMSPVMLLIKWAKRRHSQSDQEIPLLHWTTG